MNQAEETWRSFLGRLIGTPAEKQRAAAALGVSQLTLTRWVSGETEPRAGSLRKLPAIFPQYEHRLAELIRQEYDSGFTAGGLPLLTVPAEFVARVLSALATTSGPFFAWSICNLVLRQALDQLDADLLGLEITLAHCVPPALNGPVRSLCERIGAGTPPWPTGVGRRLRLVGAESLVGYVVGKGEPAVLNDLAQEGELLPVRGGVHEQSVAAYPLLRRGRLAGGMRVASTQAHFFTSERLALVEQYANLAALAFGDEEFYRLRQIALSELPPLELQQQEESFVHFREQVLLLRRQQQYRLSESEAEVRLLQDLEAAFLADQSSQLGDHPAAESAHS